MKRDMERREKFRMGFHPEAICHLKDDNKSYTGTIRDISMVCLFMEIEDCPQVSGKCDAQIILKSQHSRLVIDNLDGNVIRSDSQGIAVQFDEPLEWFNVVPLYFNKLSK